VSAIMETAIHFNTITFQYMPNIGTTELIIIAFLAILFFGKDKLPEFAKSMGESLKVFKNSASDKQENNNNSTETDTIKQKS